jgi:Animal haem peroxidase
MPPSASSAFRTHCLAPSRLRQARPASGPARYGRLFPEVPSFQADEAFLRALGRAGGICDCGDVTDEPASLSEAAAGWPVFGQFVAHDITADRSALQSHVNPGSLHNSRSPDLNLECLYGDGPIGHPFLFERGDPARFLLASGGGDVPRNREGTAVVADPRNDSHLLVSQMHRALLDAHNQFVEEARQRGIAGGELFGAAARELRWHYQWIVLDEFLPALVGRPLVDDVLINGPRWFRPAGDVFIPLEFADAAYRCGHGQIRQQYQLNGDAAPMPLFPDLLGFRPVPPERRVDWTLFFDAPGRPPAQRARKIDGRLPRSLIQLPVVITGECDVEEYHSLAARDLERGQGVGLPSGEAIARHVGLPPLSPADTRLDALGWTGETPLWYYILREAAVATGGHRLGPIGGRIVAEVLITLLDRDPTSVRFAPPDWKPRRSLIELLTLPPTTAQ